MKRNVRIPNLGGATAHILHRQHATVTSLIRQLSAIGMSAHQVWPELGADAHGADFIFFDADLGHDEQFPWSPGEAPMPLIALIGSEAPGRIEWVLHQNADAHLLKPVGGGGVYSALLIARRSFDARKRLGAEISELKDRVNARQSIVKAVALLAARGISEEQAYAQLRALAMNWQVTMEEAARRISGWSDDGGAGERSELS